MQHVSEAAILQAERIIASYQLVTGRALVAESAAPVALFEFPAVVVAHGTEQDPLLNYGNRAALALWELTWGQLVGTPSRQTAEPVHRDERARLLARVTEFGFIDDYRGIRISASGRRFEIRSAVVWNVIDQTGAHWGQAATFSHWDYLPAT